jgi:hypothetical protein
VHQVIQLIDELRRRRERKMGGKRLHSMRRYEAVAHFEERLQLAGKNINHKI